MVFCFFCIDKRDSLALREQTRPKHKEYLASIADNIAFAGPLLADDGITMQGSLLVIDFPDRAAAEAWLSNEPFTKAGLFESVSVRPFQNLWPQRTGFPPPT
jgi:uncharacterized protein YciI